MASPLPVPEPNRRSVSFRSFVTSLLFLRFSTLKAFHFQTRSTRHGNDLSLTHMAVPLQNVDEKCGLVHCGYYPFKIIINGVITMKFVLKNQIVKYGIAVLLGLSIALPSTVIAGTVVRQVDLTATGKTEASATKVLHKKSYFSIDKHRNWQITGSSVHSNRVKKRAFIFLILSAAGENPL